MSTFIKDPDASLQYEVSWASWLAAGEEITSSEWIVPVGITEVSTANTETAATIRLSGGAAGQSYAVTNRITTNQGNTDDRTITLVVRDR